MAISRYDAVDGGSAANNFTQTQTTNSQTQSNQTQTSTGVRDTTSTTRERAETLFDIDTMSPQGRQAMTQLLAQLAAGGTDTQRQLMEEQLRTLQSLRAQQSDYSRETALGDAEGLMQRTLQQALEQSLPSILMAGVGAGTSGSALTALLAQDLATRASGEAASVGTQAVQGYGNILAQLTGQEGGLVTSLEDDALTSLLQALGIDAGSTKRGSEVMNRTATTQSRERSQQEQRSSGTQRQTGTTITNRVPNASVDGSSSTVTNR